MWGTSLPEDKLAGDLGNVIGATSIGGCRSDFFTARKLAPSNLGLLQQYLPEGDLSRCSKSPLFDYFVGAGEQKTSVQWSRNLPPSSRDQLTRTEPAATDRAPWT